MKQWIVLTLLVSVATPASAYLKVGSAAPDFVARATLGGKECTFRLSEAMWRGPVVLYFYPAAFTTGCTIEAHNFAEAMPKCKLLNATVRGVSQDSIKTLDKFSVQDCRSAFPVAADTDGAITKMYDARLSSLLAVSDRTSYVITSKGDVIYAYRAMDPDHHASNALGAVKRWAQAHQLDVSCVLCFPYSKGSLVKSLRSYSASNLYPFLTSRVCSELAVSGRHVFVSFSERARGGHSKAQYYWSLHKA